MDYNCIEITNADLQRMRGSSPKDLHAKFLKEHEKVVLDAKEAKYKAKKRREIIERANSLLLLPHMTRELSKRLRDNTLKEREAQISLKNKIQESQKKQEQLWNEMQKKQLEQLDEEERIKIEKQKAAVKELAQAQLNQEGLHTGRRDKPGVGERLVHIMEDKEGVELPRMTGLQGSASYLHTSQRRKAAAAKKMKDLDDKIIEFSKKKEQMMDERRRQELLRVTEKAHQREAISEKLAQILLAKKVDTEKKLELGQKDRQENDEMKEHLRRERQRKDWEQCDKSRRLQISLKHQKELEEAEIEKYEAERSWQRAWQCKLDMDNAEREKLLKNKEFSRHYIMKMEDDNNKHNQEIQDEKDEEKKALQRVKDEDLNEISLDNIKL